MQPAVLTISCEDGTRVRLQTGGADFVDPAEGGPEGLEPSGEFDLSRFFAIGGLADCHAHLAVDALSDVHRGGELEQIRRRAFAHLARGVFLVMDKGWRDEVVLRLLQDPPSARPHLHAAGRIISGPHGYFEDFAVETDDDGLAAAISAANTTGGWIKLVGDWPQKGQGPVINFGEEALTRACAIAHAAGARVAIHTMAPATPAMAVRSGVDSIEHGLYLGAEDIALLGQRGGAWVPTIGNVLEVIKMLGPGSSGGQILGAGLENVARMLPLAAEAGVSVLAGTDLGIAHGAVATEAALLKAYGLSDRAAVAAASRSAYDYLGVPYLTTGASADMVLFSRDPNTDVAELQSPVAALRAGRIIFDRVGAFARK